jgi:outer membrane protein insertion porin family/translocation and assembly module TamA
MGHPLALRCTALGLLAWAALGCSAPGRLARNDAEQPSRDRPLLVGFRGAPALSRTEAERTIAASLERYLESGFDRAYLEDALDGLEQSLAALGYLEPRLDASVVDHPAGRRVDFAIEPGQRVRLGSFAVRGLEGLPAAAGLRVPSAGLFAPDGAGGRWFAPARLEIATDALLADLYGAGHLEARIQEPAFVRSGPLADVLIDVEAGPRQRLEALELRYRGALPAGAPSPADLEAMAQRYVGAADTPTQRLSLAAAIEERLAEAGFPDVRLERERSQRDVPGERLVSERIWIESGPRVRILSQRIVGLERTRQSFVERRLTPRPGEWFSQSAVDQSFRKLYRSGLFEQVSIRLEPGTAQERALSVELREAEARELFAEPGYGTFEGARLRAGYRDQNLWGSGRALRLEGLLAERAQRSEIGLTDPDFGGDEVLGDISVGYERRERPAFTREGLIFASRLTWPLAPAVQMSGEYRFAQSDLSELAVDPGADPELASALSEVDVASLLLAPSYDTRDRLFTPSRGLFARFGLEWASALLGSQADFLRLTATVNWYLELDREPRSVLALSARAGVIAALGGTPEVPFQERFFLGGPTSVRAFEEDRLGPKDGDGTPLGGNSTQMLSAEWRRQLVGALDAGVFYDLGAVDPSGALTIERSLWQGGPGFGVRYLLPVGPLRLDLGYNQDPGPFDSTWVLALAVGLSF